MVTLHDCIAVTVSAPSTTLQAIYTHRCVSEQVLWGVVLLVGAFVFFVSSM